MMQTLAAKTIALQPTSARRSAARLDGLGSGAPGSALPGAARGAVVSAETFTPVEICSGTPGTSTRNPRLGPGTFLSDDTARLLSTSGRLKYSRCREREAIRSHHAPR